MRLQKLKINSRFKNLENFEIDLLSKEIEKKQYWDFDFSEPETIKDEREYIEELDRLFTQAVQRQLISDVPVGSYLSGGMDSGSITAIASNHFQKSNDFLKLQIEF